MGIKHNFSIHEIFIVLNLVTDLKSNHFYYQELFDFQEKIVQCGLILFEYLLSVPTTSACFPFFVIRNTYLIEIVSGRYKNRRELTMCMNLTKNTGTVCDLILYDNKIGFLNYPSV